MKQIRRLVLISLLLILTGCNVRAVEFDRTYPDMSELDELKAEKENERKSRPEYLKYVNLIDSNTPPLPISLLSPNEDNSFNELKLQATHFCWKDSMRDCLHIEAELVLDDPDLNIPEYTIKKRKSMTLSTLPISDETPPPSNVEFALYNSEQMWYPFGFGRSNQYTYDFNAPEEAGSYLYIFKAQYDSAIGGVALFPVKLNVTN